MADQQNAPAKAGQPPVAAGTTAAATPYAAGALAPALAAAGVAALTGKALKATVESLITGFLGMNDDRFLDGTDFVLTELYREYPNRTQAELARLLTQERRFEKVFRSKMRARLARDLPGALGQGSPEERIQGLKAIFDREKRYVVAREEAMFLRALGKAEALKIKDESPEGAYWQLSPYVREHTLDCIAMSEKFWPWEVLDDFQPPVHHGCQCRLIGLDDAVRAGLMDRSQIPDTQDAIKRAKQAQADAESMQEALGEDAVRAWIDGEIIEEAVNVRPLRYAKGFEKGGEFRPQRGFAPGARLRKLFPRPSSPMSLRGEGRGRWAWVDGSYVKVPEADHWDKRSGGHHYTSPPGSTNVYRDGRLHDGLGSVSRERRRRLGSKRPVPKHIRSAADDKRTEIRKEAAALVDRSGATPPIAVGDSASSLMALRDAGFKLYGVSPRRGEQVLHMRAPATGAEVHVGFDGSRVSTVNWTPVPPPLPSGVRSEGAPKSWEAMQSDAFAWAKELAAEYDTTVSMGDLEPDSALADHAGTHEWDGSVRVGSLVPGDIAAAANARAAGRPLTNTEKAGVWSSYRSVAHEIVHGENQIEPFMYDGPDRSLEEALTEEAAHVLAARRLAEQGQGDVLDWRDSNPGDPAVQGVYGMERGALGRLLDEAGVTDPGKRAQLVLDLKFRIDPADRTRVLADALQRAGAQPDESAALTHVEGALTMRDAPSGPVVDMQSPSLWGLFGKGDPSIDPSVPSMDPSLPPKYKDGYTTVKPGELGPGIPADTPGVEQYMDEIAKTGKVMPVEIDHDGFIVDGEHRYRAMMDLGVKDIPVYVGTQLGAAGRLETPYPGIPVSVTVPKPDKPMVLGGVEGAVGPHGVMPNYDSVALTLGKPAGGTTGARWAFDADQNRWLVKRYGGDENRVATELLSNAIYRELGAKAPVAGTVTTPPSSTPDFSKLPDVPIADEPPLPALPKGQHMSTGLIVAEPDGRVWVFEPKGHFGGYEHTFSKGTMEGGLSAQQNAAKELYEETGLHARPVSFLGDYQGDTSVTRMYLAVRTGGEPLPDDPTPYKYGGQETASLKLVTPDDAEGLLNKSRDKKILADALAKGLPTGDYEDHFPVPEPGVGLAYPTLDGKPHYFSDSEKLGEHYMTDALLANWDFVGLEHDNVLWDANGDPIRVDQGGTLEYRAQGKTKPFGPVPTEVWTMLKKGQGRGNVKVTEDGMKAQAAAIAEDLTPEKIDALVGMAPFSDLAMQDRVREALKARVGWMRRFSQGTEQLPVMGPLSGDTAREYLHDNAASFKLEPDETHELTRLADATWRDRLAARLKDGQPDLEVKDAVRPIDAVIRDSKHDEDLVAYRGINVPAVGSVKGQTVMDKDYFDLTLDEDAARAQPAVLRVLIPAGAPAAPLGALGIDNQPDTLLLGRRQYLKLTGTSEVDGKTYIDAVAVRPPSNWSYKA